MEFGAKRTVFLQKGKLAKLRRCVKSGQIIFEELIFLKVFKRKNCKKDGHKKKNYEKENSKKINYIKENCKNKNDKKRNCKKKKL